MQNKHKFTRIFGTYEYLRKNANKEEYNKALAKDEEDWQQSVQNRLEGRALSKLLRSIQKS